MTRKLEEEEEEVVLEDELQHEAREFLFHLFLLSGQISASLRSEALPRREQTVPQER